MIYGIDGECVELSQGSQGEFFLSIGVCIGVKDIEEFNEEYSRTLEEAKTKYNIKGDFNVMKSYDFSKEFKSKGKANVAIKNIISSLSGCIEDVKIVYSYFRERNKILSFRRSAASSSLPVKRFHKRHLGKAYEHICAWRAFQEEAEKCICDAFNGYRTLAWEEMDEEKKLADLEMRYRGDQLSPVVSVSDMLLNLLKFYFESPDKYVYKSELSQFLDEFGLSGSPEYLGNKLLSLLAPIEDSHMPKERVVENPLYLFFKPDINQVQKQSIMDSPKGIRLRNRVSEEKGSIKFFHEGRDKTLIEGSTLVYMDEKGKKDVEALKNAGYDVDILDFRSL